MTGVRVLAVDDDPAYLRYLKLVLTRAGFDFQFTDGRSAIDKVRHDDTIGLLLVDLVMPEMDGIETLKTLRKDATSDRLYTILLTAHDSNDTKLRAFNSGFDDFLSKVASEPEIVAKVRSAAPPRNGVQPPQRKRQAPVPRPNRRAHRHRQPPGNAAGR